MDNRQTSADEMHALHAELVAFIRKALKSPECPIGLIKEARELLKDSDIQASRESLASLEQDFLDSLETYGGQ